VTSRLIPSATRPNPYEDPSCQETDYPEERIVAVFSAFFVLAQSAAGVVS
jgi:hypothetical protein